MIRGPVFSREMKMNSRSVRLPVVVLLFSSILSLVTLFNIYSVVAQVRITATIQRSSFMDTYEFVTTIELIPLMLIVPAVTAPSISGEREHQALELMLATRMAAFQVVIGKLTSALNTLLLLTMSNFPTVAMVFVYEGIIWGDAVSLLLYYVTTVFFTGNMGLYFSALFRCSTVSTMVAYRILVVVVAGTYFINKLTLPLSSMNISNSVAAHGFGENAVKATSGGTFYLLFPNSVTTLLTTLNDQIGGSVPLTKIRSYFDMTTTDFITNNWTTMGILIQLALVALTIYVAIRYVEPVKRRRKDGKKGVDRENC